MRPVLPLALCLLSGPAIGQDSRQLDAHAHGVGELDIAFDGRVVAMELRVPGSDIVGFEYAAESAEDRAAIETAVAILARPLDLFVVPISAECTVTTASAELEQEHDDHEEDLDDAPDDDHDHEDGHSEDAGHTEFHAEYVLSCDEPDALSEISFAYFDTFRNALELKVQIVTASGAQAFEIRREAPVLDLRGLF